MNGVHECAACEIHGSRCASCSHGPHSARTDPPRSSVLFAISGINKRSVFNRAALFGKILSTLLHYSDGVDKEGALRTDGAKERTEK